ncbi:hypothetical protein BDQ17DRAFT_1351329 [Cyathus striatus]|nr:hypothetical protein BDQ17DRAFT_1351329 [Cyathus striatus]
MRVPQEIADLIVDQIPLQDIEVRYASLRACALTCRSFAKHSQCHLFHTLMFHSTDKPFYDGHRELALYVREFHLVQNYYDIAHLAKERHLPAVINMLKDVTVFKLEQILGCHDWKLHFSPKLRSALTRLFVSPSLESLRLSMMFGIPSSYAKFFTDIRTVELNHVHFSEDPSLIQSPLPARTNLHALKALTISNMMLFSCVPLVNVLLSEEYALERLKVYSLCKDNAIIAHVLMNSKASLSITALEFGRSGREEDDIDGHAWISEIDIGTVPHLQSVVVQADLNRDYFFDDAKTILQKARIDNEIQDIGIQLNFDSDYSEILQCKWEGVDILLPEPPFTQLQKVYFTFSRDSCWSESDLMPSVRRERMKELKTLIGSYLPRLHNKGLLQLHSLQ